MRLVLVADRRCKEIWSAIDYARFEHCAESSAARETLTPVRQACTASTAPSKYCFRVCDCVNGRPDCALRRRRLADPSGSYIADVHLAHLRPYYRPGLRRSRSHNSGLSSSKRVLLSVRRGLRLQIRLSWVGRTFQVSFLNRFI